MVAISFNVPKLPRRKVENRTVGRVYQSKTGKRMRRGQLEACHCGQLHSEQGGLRGTPLDEETYDYRDQALGLIFFPGSWTRFWQNYRHAIGSKIQYAGAVEMQRRLATHAHHAVRGTAARALTKQVAAGTYHQVWWSRFDT